MPKRQFELLNDPEEIRSAIEEHGLTCYQVRDTGLIQIGKQDVRDHMDEISVDQFIDGLRDRGLALWLYPPSNYLKIMKAPRGKEIPEEDDEPTW